MEKDNKRVANERAKSGPVDKEAATHKYKSQLLDALNRIQSLTIKGSDDWFEMEFKKKMVSNETDLSRLETMRMAINFALQAAKHGEEVGKK